MGRRVEFSGIGGASVLALAMALTASAAVARDDAAGPELDTTTVAEIVVVAPERLDEIAGAATILTEEEYARSQPLTINDVLRRAPGLYPRSEEGLGMRPNIGFRGLNPTRSTEVLLLEDGVPLAYAPYGDNASYFHPPVERFSGLEVLKGSSQIAFGPHTVGGVVNYRTPSPTPDLQGRVLLRAGERGTRELVAQAGDTVELLGGDTGLFGSFVARDSDGSRDNQALSYRDLFFKGTRSLNADHDLTFKASWYREDSQVSYSGLRQAEYEADPRQNPFQNDRFYLDHQAASLTHGWQAADALRITTVVYGAALERDWWRQSSNSGQRPNDSSDPACGGMANVNTTCGNEGRLRQYYSYGVDSRAAFDWDAGDWSGRLSGGLRAHHENQERFQWNGDTPKARTPGVGVNAGVREQNVRQATAFSGFVESVLRRGDFALTTGVRVEEIEFDRSNKLTGQRGATSVSEVIPGVGLAWSPSETLTVFAGVHEGFSPPRVEDVINGSGGTIELDSEKSVNTEIGFRAQPSAGLDVEATWFRMDFDNQIVPASVAGGVGATLTSAGATLHEGVEFAARYSSKAAAGTEVDFYADGTLTWVGTAEYQGRRFSTVSGFGTTRVDGNRLPYSPEWLVRAAVGFETPAGLQAEIEAVYTGEMFADDLNTIAPTADGQRGRIEDALVFNVQGSWAVPGTPVRFLASIKNVTDELYVVDRSRGVLPGEPRIAQIGVEWKF